MSFIEIIAISIGLSMDAFAVALCKGLSMKNIDKKYLLLIAFFFGFFQFAMPVIGWFVGSSFYQYISSIDHWIAFVLLALIGGNMIREAVFEKDDKKDDDTTPKINLKELLVLAIATSIDALAVGISFAMLDTNIWTASITIGITTFTLSAIGVVIGNTFGIKFKSNAEVFGGIILIGIGIKILLEHLLG